MNPFDDAVIDLLSSAPDPTSLERLRARIVRRRRHRAIAVVATTTIVLTGSAGVAASLSRDNDPHRVAVAATTPSSPGGGASTTATTSTTIAADELQQLRDAAQTWSRFPVDASPRPIVLTSDPVSAPDNGFTTSDAKEAFLSGAFVAPATSPTGPAELDGLPVVSAATAFATMRNEGTAANGVPTPPTPLVVTSVSFGTASYGTDRGMRTLPAWMFSFEGVQNPAAVLAVAPSSIVIAPAQMSSVGARLSADGREVTVSFTGTPAGTGPCTADYAVDQFASGTAVVVKVRTKDRPTQGGRRDVACTAIGQVRQVDITLDAPLANRVLVDASTKAAVPIIP